MSYYSGKSSTETPQEAVNRLWNKKRTLKGFVHLLAYCDWSDKSKEYFDEFVELATKKIQAGALLDS